MGTKSVLKFWFIFVFQFFKVHNVYSGGFYEDIQNFRGPFTEKLKEIVCSDSIKTCGTLLNLYQSMHEKTTERLFELQKAVLKHENLDGSRTCQLQLKQLEKNVSESLNTIDFLSKLNWNAGLELQDLQYKINAVSNKMLQVNQSLLICVRKLDECTLNLVNVSFLLTMTKETSYRTMEKLEQKSRELNDERAKVSAINDSLKQCNKVKMEIYTNFTVLSEAFRNMEKAVFMLKNESLQCNLTLDNALHVTNLNEASLELQSSEMDKENCLNILEIQNETNIESFHTVTVMNDFLISCEHSLDVCRKNMSEYILNMSSIEREHLRMISSQKNITRRLKKKILGLAALNESLQRCELNLKVALRNVSESDLIISTLNKNLSTTTSSCLKETRALEDRLQNCKFSLELTTKDFSELKIQAKRNNVTCTETQSLFKKRTEELEHNLTEYKSLLDKFKSVPKRIQSWSVDELCRNIPSLVFEDKELCPFFYDCSKNSSYPQQCPYPQLFSDINTKCEDPSTVNCGERKIAYGYTCDFESLSDSKCFLVNSNSGRVTWTRHSVKHEIPCFNTLLHEWS